MTHIIYEVHTHVRYVNASNQTYLDVLSMVSRRKQFYIPLSKCYMRCVCIYCNNDA